MADDDLLDDLDGVSDLAFGYDDSLGDPNVKPKPPPAPTENAGKRAPEALAFVFPKLNQFLTKLLLQATPWAPPPGSFKAQQAYDPFATFSKAAAENREVVVTADPAHCTELMATGLKSGTFYVARLVATNPSGTAVGAVSAKILTPPSKPPPPKCVQAQARQVSLKFEAIGQNLEKLTIEVMMDNGAGIPPFTHGKAFAAPIRDPAVAVGVTVTNLTPGNKYYARLRAKNAAGEAVGDSNEGFVMLADLGGLSENHSQRTDKQVLLKFEPIGSFVTDLAVEYTVVVGEAKPAWSKGESKVIPSPQTASSILVDKLQPAKTYAFRLRATNPAGVAYSDSLKIDTVEFSPDMLDKSGWLQELPKVEGKKTLGRRLSLRKQKPKKFWYVLDGKLLTWYADVDGEEVGFIHLGKVADIVGDEYSDQTTIFELVDRNKESIQLLCESTDPNVSSNELCISWIQTLKAAWRPSKAPSRQQSVSENPVKREEPKGPDAPPALEEMAFEEVMGFGDFGDAEDGENGGGESAAAPAEAQVEEEGFGFS